MVKRKKKLISQGDGQTEIINKSLNEVQSISAKIKNSSLLFKVFKAIRLSKSDYLSNKTSQYTSQNMRKTILNAISRQYLRYKKKIQNAGI